MVADTGEGPHIAAVPRGVLAPAEAQPFVEGLARGELVIVLRGEARSQLECARYARNESTAPRASVPKSVLSIAPCT